jgi:AraC-like DNA-binding protein
MPKISIALILFVTLCLLAVNLWRKRSETAAATPFLIIAILAALQTLFVSLRWDFGVAQFRTPQILLAAAMPSIVWIAFQSSVSGTVLPRQLNPIHALPFALAVIALFMMPDAVDVLLVLTFVVYGIGFLRLALAGETGLGKIPFEGVINMRRAVWLMVFSLLSSALVDVLVFLDFMHGDGAHAAQLIGAGNLIWLLALGASVALGSKALPTEALDAETDAPAQPEEEDYQVVETIRALLMETELAKDPGLTLSRLARRAALPMRSVSGAINRVHGRNVSQYINDIRISEACRMLQETDISITQAIYASGFQTKSNFNREFVRVTGKTPRDWRRQVAPLMSQST